MLAYHCTWAENFDSIMTEGLQPRDTSENNWPDIENERGVYFMSDRERAIDWSYCLCDQDMFSAHERMRAKVLLTFEIPDDFEYYPDQVFTSSYSYYTPHSIPAGRIVDVEPIERG